jgi:hypothetical protein
MGVLGDCVVADEIERKTMITDHVERCCCFSVKYVCVLVKFFYLYEMFFVFAVIVITNSDRKFFHIYIFLPAIAVKPLSLDMGI